MARFRPGYFAKADTFTEADIKKLEGLWQNGNLALPMKQNYLVDLDKIS